MNPPLLLALSDEDRRRLAELRGRLNLANDHAALVEALRYAHQHCFPEIVNVGPVEGAAQPQPPKLPPVPPAPPAFPPIAPGIRDRAMPRPPAKFSPIPPGIREMMPPGGP